MSPTPASPPQDGVDGYGPRLREKVVLLSGIAGGQGRAAARLFARHGAKVVGCDLKRDGLRELAAEAAADAQIERAGGAVVGLEADITREPDVERWIGEALSRFGRIDVLYNNAASMVFGMVHEMTLEAWREGVRVELDGLFLACKHALPHLRRMPPASSAIINIASVSGMVSTLLPRMPGGMSHAAMKAGVIGITRSLAEEYAPWGIRVNAISPGAVHIPAMVEGGFDVPEVNDAVFAKLMLKRRARPEEVAFCALFLASDESSYLTGVNIPVDGGWTAL